MGKKKVYTDVKNEKVVIVETLVRQVTLLFELFFFFFFFNFHNSHLFATRYIQT